MSLIHAKATKPRIFPWNNDRDPEQIDRLQDISDSFTQNQTKLYEIARDGKLGVHKERPSVPYTARQFEYGSMAFWRSLANKEDPASDSLDESVDLDDLKNTYFDIAHFLTDEDDTFQGTEWFPKLRVNGFSINISDPNSVIERSFDLIGEDSITIPDNYIAFEKDTATGTGSHDVTLSPVPIEWASGDYIFRVLRIRSGVVTELTEDAGAGANTWAYSNSTKIVTVQTCVEDDVIKVYYPAATAYTTLWTDNDSDADAAYADQCTILMKVGSGDNTQVYQLQSVGIDVSFDRDDRGQIGSEDISTSGVKSKTVTVSLNQSKEDFSLMEAIRGTSSYSYIDPRDFTDNVTVTVKIYTDSTKATFLSGYKISNLSLTSKNGAAAVEDYDSGDFAFEADNFLVTPDESEL